MHPFLVVLSASLPLGNNAGFDEPDSGPPTTPNILVLVADDLGVDSVGVYAEGRDIPLTPNIDALAVNGLLFRNAWSNPTCSPTRATLLTGRYGFRTGVGALVGPTGFQPALPQEEWTVPELLDLGTGSAYAHAAIGKWHVGNDSVGGDLSPNLAGFSHFSGTMANFFAPYDYFNWPKVVDGSPSTSTTYATTDSVDSALQWISTVPEPWFCHVAFNAPHTPLHSPPAGLHTVDLTVPTPRLQFKAMVEAMDTEIGRLTASLPAGVLDNTMVFFVGDNGTIAQQSVDPFLPAHAKGTLYEGGINVPLIVSGPLVSSPGSEVAGLVQATDLASTFLEIAGADSSALPDGAASDSVSLVPYFADPSQASLRSHAYAEVFLPNGPLSRPLTVVADLNPLCGATVCQDDLGFGGPGTSSMSICGEPLNGGYLDSDEGAELLLVNAPPSSVGTHYIGSVFAPTALFGGTLVPVPPSQIIPFTTDAAGSYRSVVTPSQYTIGLTYHQCIVVDPSLPAGFDVSNAVAVETLRTDMEAIRNARYKLIVNNPKCAEELFDLLEDPFEQTDLLAGQLSLTEVKNYIELKLQLEALREPKFPITK